MTYAEIKNQYTSIESINTRISEIDNAYGTYSDEFDNTCENYKKEVNDFINESGINSNDIKWNCTHANHTSVELVMEGDNFYHITIYAENELVYNDKYTECHHEWKFQLNVASCGSFDILNPTEKSKKITAYYKLVANIMDEKKASELEVICKKWTNKIEEVRNSYGKLKSELKQLEILKKNMEKEVQTTEYLETAKNTIDKTMVVIINKNAEPSECVATHRGVPCSICSLPVELEKWPEEDKKCKMMNKNDKNAKYISTRIQFLKFTK